MYKLSLRHAGTRRVPVPLHALSQRPIAEAAAYADVAKSKNNEWITQDEVEHYGLHLKKDPITFTFRSYRGKKTYYSTESIRNAAAFNRLRSIYPRSLRRQVAYERFIGDQLLMFAAKFNYKSPYWLVQKTVNQLGATVTKGMGHVAHCFGRNLLFYNVDQLKFPCQDRPRRPKSALRGTKTSDSETQHSTKITASDEMKPINALSGEPIPNFTPKQRAKRDSNAWVSQWQMQEFGLKPRQVSTAPQQAYVHESEIANTSDLNKIKKLYPTSIQIETKFAEEDAAVLVKTAMANKLTSPFWLTLADCAILGVVTSSERAQTVIDGVTYINAENVTFATENESLFQENGLQEKPIDAISGEIIEGGEALAHFSYKTNQWVSTADTKAFQLNCMKHARVHTAGAKQYINIEAIDNKPFVQFMRAIYPQSATPGAVIPQKHVEFLLGVAVEVGYDSPLWIRKVEALTRADLHSRVCHREFTIDGVTYHNVANKAPEVKAVNPLALSGVTFLTSQDIARPVSFAVDPEHPTNAITGERIASAESLRASSPHQHLWISAQDAAAFHIKLKPNTKKVHVPALEANFVRMADVSVPAVVKDLYRKCPRPVVAYASFATYVRSKLMREAERRGFSSVYWATQVQWDVVGLPVHAQACPTLIGTNTLVFNGSQTALAEDRKTPQISEKEEEVSILPPAEARLPTRQCTQCYASALKRIEDNLPLADTADLTKMSMSAMVEGGPAEHRRVCGSHCDAPWPNTMCHILSGCQFALLDGRYTFRHDLVLAVLDKYLRESPGVVAYNLDERYPEKSSKVAERPAWLATTSFRPDGWVQLADGRQFILELSCPWEKAVAARHAYKTNKYMHWLKKKRIPRLTLIAFEFTVRGVPSGSVGPLREIIGLGDEVFFRAIEDMAEAVMLASLHIFQWRDRAAWAPPEGAIAERLRDLTGRCAKQLWESLLYAQRAAGLYRVEDT